MWPPAPPPAAPNNLVHAGLADQALLESHKALEIDENYWVTHFSVCEAHLAKGRRDEALAAAERAHRVAPWSDLGRAAAAGLLACAGSHDQAAELLGRMSDPPKPVFSRVVYHLLASELEAAADWYEKSIEARELFALIFALAPLTAELRRSARWMKLGRIMNLAGEQDAENASQRPTSQ